MTAVLKRNAKKEIATSATNKPSLVRAYKFVATAKVEIISQGGRQRVGLAYNTNLCFQQEQMYQHVLMLLV